MKKKNDLKTGQKAFRNSFVCDVTTKFQFIKQFFFFLLAFDWNFDFIRFHIKILFLLVHDCVCVQVYYSSVYVLLVGVKLINIPSHRQKKKKKNTRKKIFFKNWISFKKKCCLSFFFFFSLFCSSSHLIIRTLNSEHPHSIIYFVNTTYKYRQPTHGLRLLFYDYK